MAGRMSALVDLARPKNMVLAGLTVVLGAHFGLAGDWSYDHGRAVAMQILAVSAFMGAGNAMNDIKDAMIDAKAHPSRPLPSGRITETQAIRFVWLLMLFSVGSMLVGVFNLQSKGLDWWPFAVIYVVAVMLMLTYDLGPKTKARGLIGNIAISLHGCGSHRLRCCLDR